MTVDDTWIALGAMGKHHFRSIPTYNPINISWSPTPPGWIKINVDGSVFHHISKVACGGIICNEVGGFITDFVANLGSCSITLAELWGAFLGLHTAYNLGYRKVVLEVDSSCVVHLVDSNSQPWLPCATLLHSVKELLA